MNDIRASVAMAVYNGEKYIREQIDSILEIMATNDELVISYDESQDRTLSIIKEFETDSRVKIVYNKDKGVESNFNNAVEHCSGKYIFLSDQDDVWINNKIDVMINFFYEHPETKVLICDGYLSDDSLCPNGELFNILNTSVNPLRNFIKGSFLGCQMAFDSLIKLKVWPVRTNPPVPHDIWLGIVGTHYGKVDIIREKLIIHRIHRDNYSNTSKMNLKSVIKNRLLLGKEILKNYSQNRYRNDSQ